MSSGNVPLLGVTITQLIKQHPGTMNSYPNLTSLEFHCDQLMFTARETEKLPGSVSPFVTVGFPSILNVVSSLSSLLTSRSQRKMRLT